MGPLTRWLLTLSLLLFPFFPIRTAAAETPWQWPLDPRPHVLRGFDPPEQRWFAGHLGADLAADVGQPVLASADGVVHFVGKVAGVPVVSVAHGDLRTTYLPVRASTARGDPVLAGDELGILAAEPAHCLSRPCLHFGLLRGAAYLDPLGPLGHGPVRLLPRRFLGGRGRWMTVGPEPRRVPEAREAGGGGRTRRRRPFRPGDEPVGRWHAGGPPTRVCTPACCGDWRVPGTPAPSADPLPR